ncbi:uncharacterized protein [Miscanthus floridulus]|uniref:uncharacterized protein n=1 Tax=Miscanthus floridulus TaxID=154761 RepID=UPI00345A6AC3
MEVPTLAPLKALKVNPSSITHWVAEAQATLQRGMALARADPKESVTQGGATKAAPTQTGEGAPSPRKGEAHESDGAKVPSVAEATEIGAPRVSEAEATEAGVPRTAEAAAAGAKAPATTEATMVKAGAPGTTEADVIAARLSAQEVEMKAAKASVAPLAKEATALGKVLAGQLGVEQSAHQLMKGALDEALKVVEAFRTEAVVWRGKAEELEAEVTRAAEASIMVQAVLETEIREHDTLKGATCTTYEALEVEGAISDGYVLPDDDEEADEAVTKLIEAVEGPGMVLAKLFEDEVVPPPPFADAGGPEP